MPASETSQSRDRLKKYCTGYGLDIGYGGDPIIPSAITVDLPTPYTDVGGAPLNLGGDARNLHWFRANCLDYVYSSHLLEDFDPGETKGILQEWLRVLKPGGHLILYLPDEQKYRKYCRETGQPYNQNHRVEKFDLSYVKSLFRDIRGIEIVHENPACERYSFEIVVRKGGTAEGDEGSKKGAGRGWKKIKNRVRAYFFIRWADRKVLPRRFTQRNFHADGIWTNGCGIIKDIDYRLSANFRLLVLETKGFHPFVQDLERLRLKLWINGCGLKLLSRQRQSFYFELDPNLREIGEIKIESTTFIPKELGMNEDVRCLGIDVDHLRIE